MIEQIFVQFVVKKDGKLILKKFNNLIITLRYSMFQNFNSLQKKHNLWNYIYLILYVQSIEEASHTVSELHVLQKWTEISNEWFPMAE